MKEVQASCFKEENWVQTHFSNCKVEGVYIQCLNELSKLMMISVRVTIFKGGNQQDKDRDRARKGWKQQKKKFKPSSLELPRLTKEGSSVYIRPN
mmetsp:Transcript_21494/g.24351  ORF Transcript_21494/g.24351 Transcript_21494/m.24351 type:complete len:95 (+) Transcript_21494:1123-1407(+)